MTLMKSRPGTERYPGGSKTHLFLCECGDSHYIRIERDFDFDDCNSFELDDHFRPRKWRDRIVLAVKALLGKECINAGFIIDEETAAEITEALSGDYPKGNPVSGA